MIINSVVWKAWLKKLQRVVKLKSLIQKMYFETKTPVVTAFFTVQPDFPVDADSGDVVEASVFFWTVAGQSEAKLLIFMRP